jgi:hypothetical protein
MLASALQAGCPFMSYIPGESRVHGHACRFLAFPSV